MITIYINGKQYQFSKKLTVLQACEYAGYEIPKFCYHDKLSIAGNCRACLIEIAKSPKPVASCSISIENNMEIFTDSPLARKAREGVMEKLLINHPLDCPVCDQGGECDLQDLTRKNGSDRSRFFDKKRTVKPIECGSTLTTVMTRCIHCTRCIRFSSEIAGDNDFGAFLRNDHTEIGLYIEKHLVTELSGNMIDLCPVGALTSNVYKFSFRNSELTQTTGIDPLDAVGSNITIFTKNTSKILKKKNDVTPTENFQTEIVKILPRVNENINENWISDKTRYFFDTLTAKNRLKQIKKHNTIINDPWIDIKLINNLIGPEIYQKNIKIDKIFKNFCTKTIVKSKKADASFNLITLFDSVYNFWDLKEIYNFIQLYGSPNIQYSNTLYNYNIDHPNFFRFNSLIQNIDNADAILLIGTDIRSEASMINTRIRKQSFKYNIPVGFIGAPTDLCYKKMFLGDNINVFLNILEGKHFFCKILRKSKNPLVIIGNSLFKRLNDSRVMLNLINFLTKKTFLYSKKKININFLHSNTNLFNACFLGIVPGTRSILYKNLKHYHSNILISLNLFKIKNKKWLNKKTISIGLNTHENGEDKNFNYLFPIKTIFEYPMYHLNTENICQENKPIITNTNSHVQTITSFINKNTFCTTYKIILLNQKTTIYILKLKNLPVEFKEKYLNKNQWVKNFNKTVRYSNQNIKTISFIDITKNNKIYTTQNFIKEINDFYITDKLTQNSKIMRRCSNYDFLHKNFSYWKH